MILFTIAYYEAKSFLRNHFIKVYVGMLAVVLFFIIAPVIGTPKINTVPAALPYLAALYINKAQVLALLFATSLVFLEDIRNDSSDALYARSFYNLTYVLGKVLGLAVPFLVIDAIVMLTFFIIHAVFLQTLVIPALYLYYPLIIILPSLIVTIGVAALIAILFRHQATVYAGLLLVLVLMIASFGASFPQVHDFSGSTLPLLYSEFTGFGNIQTILLQRAIFLFVGLGLLLISGLLFSRNRLPQARKSSIVVWALVIIMVCGAGFSGRSYLHRQYAGRDLRNQMRALEETSQPCLVSLESCALDFVHNGSEIEVTSSIAITNTSSEALDTYRFRLNPGLEVTSVEQDGSPLPYTRDLHLLSITPKSSLGAGERDSLVITYNGTIDDRAGYIDIDEHQHAKVNSKYTLNIDKRLGFVSPDYVLLTNEINWYPTPLIPSRNDRLSTPPRDFTDFQLTVVTDSSLTAISQGEPQIVEPGNYSFTPEYPLPQLSLVIGPYSELSTTVDGITYTLYEKIGHDYTRGLESLDEQDIQEAIRELRGLFENRMNLSYPFNRLTLVEVPLQFLAYDRIDSFSPATMQPEQVLLPEQGFLFRSNPHFYRRATLSGFRSISPQRQRPVFETFFKDLLLIASYQEQMQIALREKFGNSSMEESFIYRRSLPTHPYTYSLFPLFYSYATQVHSKSYPMADLLLQYRVLEDLQLNFLGSYSRNDGVADIDVIVRKLNERFTIPEIIDHPDYSYMMRNVLQSKTEMLFTNIQAKSGLELGAFDHVIADFIEHHRFQTASADSFFNALADIAGIDITDDIEQWQGKTIPPKFVILENKRMPMEFDGHDGYYYRLRIQNIGGTGGTINVWIAARTNTINSVSRYIYLEGNQIKDIGIITPYTNTSDHVCFNTYNSYNNYFFIDVPRTLRKIPASEVFDGERIIELPPQESAKDTIIVDNLDDGFKLTQPERPLIKRLLGIDENENMLEVADFNVRKPPHRWREGNDDIFYGPLETNAYFIADGNGDAKATWEAELPETGEYDVYFYKPGSNGFWIPHPTEKKYAVGDFQFIIDCGDTEKEVTVNAWEGQIGWKYIGTFTFPEKRAVVELTNKTNGKLVYADAVRFVRTGE